MNRKKKKEKEKNQRIVNNFEPNIKTIFFLFFVFFSVELISILKKEKKVSLLRLKTFQPFHDVYAILKQRFYERDDDDGNKIRTFIN